MNANKAVKKNKNVLQNIAAKVTNFVKKQPVPQRKIDGSKNITKWDNGDGGNDLPQQLISAVKSSPFASSALDIWHTFTNGDGFVDPELNDRNLGGDFNLSELNYMLSRDVTMLEGIAVHITYNLQGEIVSYKNVAFENIRLGELNEYGVTDYVIYNPYFGTRDFQEKFSRKIYLYNPEKVIEQIQEHNLKYNIDSSGELVIKKPFEGQIFWKSIEKPLARVYPQPFYDSSIDLIKIDSKVPEAVDSNLDNDLLQKAVINVYGDPDAPAGPVDKDGNQPYTQAKMFNDQFEAIEGSKNTGGFFINWIQAPEQRLDMQAMPTNGSLADLLNVQKQNMDMLPVGLRVPRILMNIQTTGKLGDTNEILNAISLMNVNTKFYRQFLEKCYGELFGDGKDYSIKEISIKNIIPTWVIDLMTPEEKRKFANEFFGTELEIEAEQQIEPLDDTGINVTEENGG